jgi:MFS family permease
MYSQPYKFYVTVALLVAYVFNQADRAVFGFLMEPIKREFGLTDTQLGFLSGPAFVLLYTVLGIPVARWADRSHRVNIMSAAIAIWSVIAASTAVASSFGQLAFARIGVGIGEAGFAAIAISVIGDYHSNDERTRAISRLMLGIPIAAVLSNLTAGWISEEFGWRAVFVAAGLPGALIAVVVKLTITEPQRRLAVLASPATSRPSLRLVVTKLWERRTLRHLAIAQALANVVLCATSWFSAFFIRNHHMSLAELGTWFAVVAAVGGFGGIWLSGQLTGRYGARDPRFKVRFMTAASALSIPMVVFVLWCPVKEWALVGLLLAQIPLCFFLGPTYALVQDLTEASMRATMASLFILLQVMLGGVIGTQLVGVFSDAFTPLAGNDALGLRWGIALMSLVGLWAAAHFWQAEQSIALDLRAEPASSDSVAKTAPVGRVATRPS